MGSPCSPRYLETEADRILWEQSWDSEARSPGFQAWTWGQEARLEEAEIQVVLGRLNDHCT